MRTKFMVLAVYLFHSVCLTFALLFCISVYQGSVCVCISSMCPCAILAISNDK